MKIESITLREIRMRLKSPFETSFGSVQDRRIVLVEVVADGASGWGEVTVGETPAYNAETTDTAWHVLTDFLAPSLERAMGIEPTSEAWEALNKTLKAIEWAALSFPSDSLNWKLNGN